MALFVWSACLGLLLVLAIDKAISSYKAWRKYRYYDGGCSHSPIKCYFCSRLDDRENHNALS